MWLQQMLQRWRSHAAARAVVAAAGKAVVLAGHVVVCVGGTSWRFVVRVAHLNHPMFRELLWQAEEYGFPSGTYVGHIALPCDEDLFEHILLHLSSPSKSSRFITLEDFKSGALFCCCVATAGDSLPLLHGISGPKLAEYFGNNISAIRTEAVLASELLARGHGWAAAAVGRAVAAHRDASIRARAVAWAANPALYTVGSFPTNGVVTGSSPQFDMHGCNFGWGKALTTRSGMANKVDGKVSL